jgi:glycosyltransferase involved in cell wall biosynthesis
MRILEVNKYLYLRRGAEKHMLDLVELLQKNGHDVRLFGMEHEQNIPVAQKEDLLSYVGYNKDDSSWYQRLVGGGRIFWSFEAARKMQNIITEWQPEIIHIHNIYHQLSFSLLAVAKKTDTPVVMTVHDYAVVSPDKDQYYPEIGKQYWKFMRVPKYSFSKRLLLVLRAYGEEFLGGYDTFVDIFIVPSKMIQEVLLTAGIPSAKIKILPHFITPEKKRATENVMIKNAPERFILALTGASQEKNTPWLEEVCVELGIPLVIAGSVELGYKKHNNPGILYVGKKNQTELHDYWQQAVAGVSASRLPETFGLIALESLAQGKPFFCFDAGAYKEVVRTGIDGVVAQDEAELILSLQKAWSKESSYDLFSIQKSAEERFGAIQYLEKFIAILRTLS